MFLFIAISQLTFGLSRLPPSLGARCLLAQLLLRILVGELLPGILCVLELFIILRIILGVCSLASLSIRLSSYCTQRFICSQAIQPPFQTISLILDIFVLYDSLATAVFFDEYSWTFRQIVTRWPMYPFLHFWLPEPALIFWSSSVSANKNFRKTSSFNNCYNKFYTDCKNAEFSG